MTLIEVAIGPGNAAGTFRVNVASSAVGEASATVELDADLLLARRSQLQQEVLASAAPVRGVPQTEQLLRDTGQALFTALLGTGEVAGRYRAAQAVATERGQGLRVVLRIDTPALAGLPWEAMYDHSVGGYVCRNDQVVRHVPVASVPAPLLIQPPLRILGVVSSPRGLPSLDVDKEKDQLARALARPAGQGLVEVHWAPSAAWADLQDLLLDEEWHVLHFIGHGDFDPGRDEGVLGLVGEDGRADWVAAHRLTSLLRQARPMPRLVVLSSCSGAVTGATDLFSGTAAALVRGGVSAVAAMQYKVSDPAAIAFARGFYAAIARGRGVDDAISSGRVAILGVSDRTLEWVTPVLYLREHDPHQGANARLFILPARPAGTSRGRAGAEDASAARHDPPDDTSTPSTAGRDTRANSPGGQAPARQPSAARADSSSQLVAPRPSTLIRTLGHTDWVTGVAFSPDGTLLATATFENTARLWQVADGAPVRVLTGHTDLVRGVAFSPDGKLLATASDDDTARLWQVDSGASVHILSGHTKDLRGVAFSPDGTLLATASNDNTARLWQVTDGGPLVNIRTGHTEFVLGVAFSPDGKLLATGGDDYTARLWQVPHGALVRTLTGHASYVRGVAFSPDGKLLATASDDNTARLWQVTDGAPVRTLIGHTDRVLGVAFNPDGTLLATASKDNTARLWQVTDGAPVRVLTGHTSDVSGVAFSPDGTLLATASHDTTVRLWR